MLNNIKSLFSFFSYLPEKRKNLSFAVLIMGFSNLISLFIPLIAMRVIDKLKNNDSLNLHSIISLILFWFLAIVITSFLDHWQKLSFRKYGNHVLMRINDSLISDLYRVEIKEWTRKSSKEISDELQKDLEDINPLVTGVPFIMIRHLTIIVITTILLFAINWQLAMGIFVLLPFFLVSYMIWDNVIKKRYRFCRRKGEQFLSRLIEIFQTLPLIRFYNTFGYEKQHINHYFRELIDKRFDYFITINKRQTYSRIISSIAPVYLAFFAFLFIHYHLATLGEIFAFWGLFSLAIGSVTGLSTLYLSLLNAIVVYNKIKGKLCNKHTANINGIAISEIKEIACNQLAFSYDARGNTNIYYPSILLNKGQQIELRGRSGAGKTTLIKLLFGLMKPKEGDIYVNGISINCIDQYSYLDKIGYVEQNGYIYSRSLKDNIILGREYDVNKWNIAIQNARLDIFLKKLKYGGDESTGENGIQLSGGEKQRILIARALYNNPQWLFLDEPFSGIENKQQKEIEAIIQSLSENITIVLITHQKDHAIAVDKVVDLDRGCSHRS